MRIVAIDKVHKTLTIGLLLRAGMVALRCTGHEDEVKEKHATNDGQCECDSADEESHWNLATAPTTFGCLGGVMELLHDKVFSQFDDLLVDGIVVAGLIASTHFLDLLFHCSVNLHIIWG